MSQEVRVRYAPSPTGHLHIGGARTALFNYLFARHHNGKFIVRIEDTDIERNVPGGEQSQLENLKWLGIDYDESVDKDGGYGPYRQTERLDIYRQYANELLEKGYAYKCFCTPEELEQEREAQKAAGIAAPQYSGKCRHLTPEQVQQLEAEGKPYTLRIKVPEGKVYEFEDMVRGKVVFESKDIGDWVIVKANGIPTYNFAVVIDDYLMKITHVFRGEEHLSNTPKQLMIYEYLGWEPPRYGHMTLIVNEQRKKLSKRDESIIQFVSQYKELGYLPEAMFNFFALLGWSPEGEEELFTKEELIRIFDVSRLSKSPSMFDKQKLTWMNNQYIKKLDLDRLVELSLPHLIKAGCLPAQMTGEQREWARQLIALYQEQMSYGAEIVELSKLFFKEDVEYDEEARAVLVEEQVPAVLKAFLEAVKNLETLDAESIKAAIKAVQKTTGQKGKKLFMPIRVATTGQTHGPELPLAIQLLGKEKVIQRLEKLID
ncbi:glutamate--tRNA ligase [Anoxybacillus rupiensis]|jgi:nondiscriminating glutamyl-tRNA synthetase|uniref:Glutamate--tRNA ligase n=1 Tax=Anoxybacteroides rupiense TaxID=311460 RepID=A0ABD5IYA1_9BACL|nr:MULTISPECIES: glutamate--tRNA ligase [Anoxybacillus]MBB3909061.1 nondiscriminating glutamyl-tRNA synthetase [Anoxybacillus rupiensis]MBS2772442.1 glutamate--tRNA ligase [Anoxybacillus rupiensis]MDE8565124.1 glutamate--tRNA ligase [Anoxybacillus rupiensis]MED5053309.1 glutamate--tRNA ligase [Anoxybacillus rupiensis]OQM45298.1 glutamate--tRNA ligase [Anoxybacillus sp. UARK-01]